MQVPDADNDVLQPPPGANSSASDAGAAAAAAAGAGAADHSGMHATHPAAASALAGPPGSWPRAGPSSLGLAAAPSGPAAAGPAGPGQGPAGPGGGQPGAQFSRPAPLLTPQPGCDASGALLIPGAGSAGPWGRTAAAAAEDTWGSPKSDDSMLLSPRATAPPPHLAASPGTGSPGSGGGGAPLPGVAAAGAALGGMGWAAGGGAGPWGGPATAAAAGVASMRRSWESSATVSPTGSPLARARVAGGLGGGDRVGGSGGASAVAAAARVLRSEQRAAGEQLPSGASSPGSIDQDQDAGGVRGRNAGGLHPLLQPPDLLPAACPRSMPMAPPA
jgi:hypothetical protein